MNNNSLSYLLQYSATGALFYVFYENSREQFGVLDSLLPPGDIRIQTKDGTVCGKCNLRQQGSGFERIIRDSYGHGVARLMRNKENEYSLKDAEGEVTIIRNEIGFCGYCDNKKIFLAQRITDLRELNQIYVLNGYDMTYGYELIFLESVSEVRKMWLSSFPLLYW